MNIAVLSNVNVDPIIQMLSKGYNVLRPEGYGNLFEMLLNKASAYYQVEYDATFILIDIQELIKNCGSKEECFLVIEEWFDMLRKSIEPAKTYFISDVDCRKGHTFIGELGENLAFQIEVCWYEHITKLRREYTNIFLFEYQKLVRNIGQESFYSSKLWYLGKIPHSNKAQKIIAKEIEGVIQVYKCASKKVLLLDLDNTLWGGIVGEDGRNGIKLSEDVQGGIYKDFQRNIKKIKEMGVILCIVSKNNEKDAMTVINNHEHMYLKAEDFVIKKINWEHKYLNIKEIAMELNLGLDSFVFVDDNPVERESVKTFLPEVEVPEFPSAIEELPIFALDLYERYFKKLRVTREDTLKTSQYLADIQRKNIKSETMSFSEYIKQLEIKVRAIPMRQDYIERLHQLINKTNQFNLTTKRYDLTTLTRMMQDNQYKIYLFKAEDKFADNGIISAVIVDKYHDNPEIDSFVMSCRVMGKFIENYIIDYVENDLLKEGYNILRGVYIKTDKNTPVQTWYDELGYDIESREQEKVNYIINLNNRRKREYYLKEVGEEHGR